MPVIRTKVNRKAAETDDSLVWNGFINVLAMSERTDLTPAQVAPYLAFWYDSEVQNGGHLQYFLNKGVDEAKDALDALALFKADAQREILLSAIDTYIHSNIDDWETAEEYDALWTQGHFDEHDSRYYECTPEITELLQRYLDNHADDFIEFTDERVRNPHEITWHTKLRFRIRRFLGLMP